MPWTATRADSEAGPIPWVVASSMGGHLFKMVPGVNERTDGVVKLVKPPFGVAYELDEAGELKEIWRTTDWYAREGYLSDEGRYLVRVGGWPRDFEGLTDLAVAFYDSGRLVKQYAIKDLIKNREALVQSVGHYFWRPRVKSRPDGLFEDRFEIVLADKTRYTFDVRTGKVVTTSVDAGAKNYWEVVHEEGAARSRRAAEILGRSPLKQDLEKQFTLTGMSTGGYLSGVHFEGEQWRAELEPHPALAYPCQLDVVFPLIQGDRIDCQFTATELVTALQTLMKRPEVASAFKNEGATGLIVRISGDRLHCNTQELQRLLQMQGREKAEGKSLRDWMEVSLVGGTRSKARLFFNVKTGERVMAEQTPLPGKRQ